MSFFSKLFFKIKFFHKILTIKQNNSFSSPRIFQWKTFLCVCDQKYHRTNILKQKNIASNTICAFFQQRQIRSLTQDVIPFLHNIIFQYTNPLPFETQLHPTQTKPILREHAVSCSFYFRYKKLDKTSSQTPF